MVTGSNGYIGNAVAKAFHRRGWKTFGLSRSSNGSDLAMHEIHPLQGSLVDPSFLDTINQPWFDVVVSNTEDKKDPEGHLEKIRDLMEIIGHHSKQNGVRPLFMYTSGCKDYGMMKERDGDPTLCPHTEKSQIYYSPALAALAPYLAARTKFSQSIISEQHALYDAATLRPTNVYGYTSSHYGMLFELAEKSESTLQLYAFPQTIMQALHIDDCAEAYVSLAEYEDRHKVAQQAFNISPEGYHTAREIGEALAGCYGLELKLTELPEDLSLWSAHGLANYSQWVCSKKLRLLTGWRELKPSFVNGIDEYRMAYEAAKMAQHSK